jgi:2,4-dienoyl-CoA reductase-like NADH-dependent reductase (Old Yellow Enzyme family)
MHGLSLANRLAVAPMTRVTATAEGLPTERMVEYYRGFARGGFGLLFSEGTYPDKAYSQGYMNQPGLADDAQAHAWRAVTSAVHAEGSKIIAQLMHAGALSQGNPYRKTSAGPSAIRPKGGQLPFYYGNGPYMVPEEMTDAQIDEAIEGFVASAQRAAWLAGFDAVEIHGANGYLLDQFLSEYSNQRTDRWGGSIAHRVSLLVETVRRVKHALKGSIPVGIRLSQGKVNDFHAKWSGGEADAAIIFSAVADAGADFIHVTEFEAWQPAFDGGNTSLAVLAKTYAPDIPIIANGSLHDLHRAEELLRAGVDIIAMGRGALANPNMPALLAAGAALRPFDSTILGPVADIKDSELELRRQAIRSQSNSLRRHGD